MRTRSFAQRLRFGGLEQHGQRHRGGDRTRGRPGEVRLGDGASGPRGDETRRRVAADASLAQAHPRACEQLHGAGVGGADLAVAEGEIAGASAAAAATGRAFAVSGSAKRRRSAGRAFAKAMHEAFAVPPGWQDWLTPETVVCRCEEVTAGRIGDAIADLGAEDARSVKLLARPGMGLCQGRVCGYATACIVASSAGRAVTAADLAATASRPIAQPVPLSMLVKPAAALIGDSGSSSEAVVNSVGTPGPDLRDV